LITSHELLNRFYITYIFSYIIYWWKLYWKYLYLFFVFLFLWQNILVFKIDKYVTSNICCTVYWNNIDLNCFIFRILYIWNIHILNSQSISYYVFSILHALKRIYIQVLINTLSYSQENFSLQYCPLHYTHFRWQFLVK
jgi:hypothetical protein